MSPKKKNKLKNSRMVRSAGKHKGPGIKRVTFYTSSQRQDDKRFPVTKREIECF